MATQYRLMASLDQDSKFQLLIRQIAGQKFTALCDSDFKM